MGKSRDTSRKPNKSEMLLDILSVARDPEASEMQLLALCGESNTTVKQAISMNQSSTEAVLLSLVDYWSKTAPSIAVHIIRHKNCTNDVIVALFRLRLEQIDSFIAESSNAPQAILRELFERDDSYAYPIARNKNCPLELFLKFFCDEDISIRIAVAKNPKCPLTIIEEMLRLESDVSVLRALILREDIPDDFILNNLHKLNLDNLIEWASGEKKEQLMDMKRQYGALIA